MRVESTFPLIEPPHRFHQPRRPLTPLAWRLFPVVYFLGWGFLFLISHRLKSLLGDERSPVGTVFGVFDQLGNPNPLSGVYSVIAGMFAFAYLRERADTLTGFVGLPFLICSPLWIGLIFHGGSTAIGFLGLIAGLYFSELSRHHSALPIVIFELFAFAVAIWFSPVFVPLVIIWLIAERIRAWGRPVPQSFAILSRLAAAALLGLMGWSLMTGTSGGSLPAGDFSYQMSALRLSLWWLGGEAWPLMAIGVVYAFGVLAHRVDSYQRGTEEFGIIGMAFGLAVISPWLSRVSELFQPVSVAIWLWPVLWMNITLSTESLLRHDSTWRRILGSAVVIAPIIASLTTF